MRRRLRVSVTTTKRVRVSGGAGLDCPFCTAERMAPRTGPLVERLVAGETLVVCARHSVRAREE